MPGTPSFHAGSSAASRRPVGGALDPVFVFGTPPVVGPVPAADRHDAGRADRGTPSDGATTNWLLGRNVPIRRLARFIERAAEVECTVLLRGECGTGKELWARLLHQAGPRGTQPFVAVDCAGLTPGQAAIHLFGRQVPPQQAPVGGAGALREAHGGVLFLDQVDALPAEVQPQLLRAIERREVVPVGSDRPVTVDVQVVAATSRNLEQEVTRGAFDRGLYYRLNMLELRVPPLRERIEDIPSFVEFFSRRTAERLGLPPWRPSADALQAFCEHPWQGNVRELEQVIEQIYRLAAEPRVFATETATAGGPLPRHADHGDTPFDVATPRGDAVRQALAATRGRGVSAGGLDGVHAARINALLGKIPRGSQGG